MTTSYVASIPGATSEPTQLAAWLSGLESFFNRYVVFPSEHHARACALWTVDTHVADQFEVAPLLVIKSAEKRSGKSRLLECLELVVREPYRLVMPSEAVIYTLMGQEPRPTILLDEADALFHLRSSDRFEGIRAVLNAGWRKGSPVPRVVMDGRKRHVEKFDPYGPKAIAGIGDLPDTITDRAVVIELKRQAPHERAERFRIRIAEREAARLCEYAETPVSFVPDVPVPETLNDRAQDVWEPLLSIAAAAGGGWAALAWEAALALGTTESSVSDGVRLLADIREAFEDSDVDHLATVDILRTLHGIEDAPWHRWSGQPITPHALAHLLGPYGIRPVQARYDGAKERGYRRHDFEDAWRRYLPETTGTSGTNGAAVEAEARERGA